MRLNRLSVLVGTTFVLFLITSLEVEPAMLFEVELASEQSEVVSIKLTPHKPIDLAKLETKCVFANTSLTEPALTVQASIVESSCVVTFTAHAQAPRGAIEGDVVIRLPDDEDVVVRIPFRVTVKNSIELYPAKLFLRNIEGSLFVQLLVQTEKTAELEPLVLTWIGEDRAKCEFSFEDKDGQRIIDLEIDPKVASHVTHLEVSANDGKFVKQVPVIVP